MSAFDRWIRYWGLAILGPTRRYELRFIVSDTSRRRRRERRAA